ncbi:MAG: CPBP family intramembrane metalloprotease [Devosia nanyangense]|nr:CPBP family intramembrane metalloprotease [Devosia nanyangense]
MPATVAFLAVNALLVGFSEETMFRGVLYRGLRSRLSFWPAAWVTSAIFGCVHVLNSLGTGDLLAASLQAITAFMAGTFFLAVVLRTRSILPAILLHAAWDFLLLTMASSTPDIGPIEPSLVTLSLPLLLDLPLFIYALFILRKAAAQERELGSAGAALSSASA